MRRVLLLLAVVALASPGCLEAARHKEPEKLAAATGPCRMHADGALEPLVLVHATRILLNHNNSNLGPVAGLNVSARFKYTEYDHLLTGEDGCVVFRPHGHGPHEFYATDGSGPCQRHGFAEIDHEDDQHVEVELRMKDPC